jgi:hypothetical protein
LSNTYTYDNIVNFLLAYEATPIEGCENILLEKEKCVPSSLYTLRFHGACNTNGPYEDS